MNVLGGLRKLFRFVFVNQDGENIEIKPKSTLTEDATADFTLSLPDSVDDEIVTLQETQTLENKRLNNPKLNEDQAVTATAGQLNNLPANAAGDITDLQDNKLNNSGTDTFDGTLTVTGDIVVTGNVDGRDVSVDGTNQDNHIASTANPHGVTAAQVDAYTIAQTDAAIDADVSAHSSLTTGVHGVTGDVVGTTDDQDLSNKDLIDPDFSDNTDTSKKAELDLTGIDAATKRTLTVQNKSYTLADDADVQAAQADATQAISDAAAVQSNLNDHEGEATGAHAASAISTPSKTNLGGAVDVETALSNVDTHVGDTSNPHGVTAAQVGAYTTTQTDAAIDADVSAHSTLTTGVHGVTGDVVGTTDDQTLTNKELTLPEINETGVSVTATSSEINQLDGNTVGGTTAGDIVTIDGAQELTNKTISKDQVGLSNVDNTSDVDKPISTATQTALDLKYDKAGGAIGGSVDMQGNLLTNALIDDIAVTTDLINLPASGPVNFATQDGLHKIIAGTDNILRGITNAQSDIYIMTVELTGGVTIKNEDGSITEAEERIRTGTQTDLVVANQASVILVYNSETKRWQVVGGSGSGGASLGVIVTSTASTAATNGNTYLVDTGTDARTIALPELSAQLEDQVIWVMDKDNNASVNNITITPNGGESIDNVAESFIIDVSDGWVKLSGNAGAANWSIERPGVLGEDPSDTLLAGNNTWTGTNDFTAATTLSGGISGNTNHTGVLSIGNNPQNANELEIIKNDNTEVALDIWTNNTGTTASSIYLRNSTGTGFNDGLRIVHGAGVTKFNDLVGETQMSIDMTNSRVGIGTSSPENNVHIKNGDSGLSSRAETELWVESSGRTEVMISSQAGNPANLFLSNGNSGSNTYAGLEFNNNTLSLLNNNSPALNIIPSGNVGIGISIPGAKLQVNGPGGGSTAIRASTGGVTSSDYSLVCTNGFAQTTFEVRGDSKVVINQLTSTDPLATDANGIIIAGTSDSRLKENIHNYTKGLSEVNSLNPVTFTWKTNSDMNDGGKVHPGFIAQEVALVDPNIVSQREQLGLADCNTFTAKDLVPMLVNAIQELSDKNDELLSRIETLENS